MVMVHHRYVSSGFCFHVQATFFFLFEYCSCVSEQQSKDLVYYSMIYFQHLKDQYVMNSLIEFNKGNPNQLCKTLVISQKSPRLYIAYKTKPMITINCNIIM